MGYSKPREERITVNISYTTRYFRRSPDDFNGDVTLIVPAALSGKRGGVALAQEDHRWTVTLLSHFGEGAPADLPGFIEFARTLAAPYLYELVRRAEPLDEASVLRFPASVRRRYEELERFPEGYLVIGGAISSFNPIYGQGMTAAALQALALQSALAEGSNRLASRFFARVSKVIDIRWSMAVGADLRRPDTVGRRILGVKIINSYMTKLHKAAHRVANLLASPASLMHPRIAARVLWNNLCAQRRHSPFRRVASVGTTR
jgi:2-polyprenyl-6-methoxyphenol hydroxylase-like FAD-dependent oxidoreductase